MKRSAHYSVDKIKNLIAPADFYMRELRIDRFGSRFQAWVMAGLCPFHDDSHAGSFKVNLNTGSFKCWSCGEGGGDIIAFIQKRNNLSCKETLELLVSDWRIPC